MSLQTVHAATAVIEEQGTSVHLFGVTLKAGADVATVILRSGGATGTVILSLAAAIGETIPWIAGDTEEGVLSQDGLHATITGTAPIVNIERV